MIIFDVESCALPFAEVEQFKPEFVADARLKDPVKIEADLEDKKVTWIEKLALKAHTAKILAIGILDNDNEMTLLHGIPEEEMLKEFWEKFRKFGGFNFVGHNIIDWDVPFMIRRSFILGVTVPFETMEGRYLSRRFVDTMKTWACGNGEMVSLDLLARIFKVGQKNGEAKDFARLYSNEKTRQQALGYLENDLRMTHAVAEKMGIS